MGIFVLTLFVKIRSAKANFLLSFVKFISLESIPYTILHVYFVYLYIVCVCSCCM